MVCSRALAAAAGHAQTVFECFSLRGNLRTAWEFALKSCNEKLRNYGCIIQLHLTMQFTYL